MPKPTDCVRGEDALSGAVLPMEQGCKPHGRLSVGLGFVTNVEGGPIPKFASVAASDSVI